MKQLPMKGALILWAVSLLIAFTSIVPSAYAAPTAADGRFPETLDIPTTFTINVHEQGLASGDPAPIYVQNIFTPSLDAPASITTRRVGNSCIEVTWGADNPDRVEFSVDYSLIAGDGSTSNAGRISFFQQIISREVEKIDRATAPPNDCEDPNNTPPVTTPRNLNFGPTNGPVSFPIITASGPATDVDGNDTLRLTDVACWTQPTNGTVSVDPANPTGIVFTPNAGFISGSDSFEYCVTDSPISQQQGVRGQITFTIAPPIESPVVADDTAQTNQLESVVIDVRANDTVIGGEQLFTGSSSDRGGVLEVLSVAECATVFAGIDTECIRYTPPPSDANNNPFVGTDRFTYSVAEGEGPSSTATVTVDVLPPTPVVADDTAVTDAGVPVDINVRFNDTVAQGEQLTEVSETANGGSVQILTVAACSEIFIESNTACLRYSPPAAQGEEPPFSGTDSFSYTVANGPVSSTAVVTVTVNAPAPMAPQLVPDTATTDIGVPVVIDVRANDTRGIGDDLASVSATANGGVAEVLDPATCIRFINGTETPCVRYTPPPPDANGVVFIGEDSFTYTVVNGDESSSTPVTVTVVAPPGTPEPAADEVSDLAPGVPVVIDVLANDSDDNGIAGLSIVSVTEPANGVAQITRNNEERDVITYTPNADFAGSDSFFYTVSDGDEQTADRAAEVTVGVVITQALTPLAPFALSPTELAVATAIDSVCNSLTTLNLENPLTGGEAQLLERCTALIGLANPGGEGEVDTAAIREALRQIAGEEIFAQGTINVQILNTQIKNISSRLAALRAGASGVNTQGLAMNVNGKTLPRGLFSSKAWRGGGASADDESENALLADSKLGFFINGRANFGEQDPNENENGFEFDTLGLTAGLDYRFTDKLAIGGALGFSDSEAGYNGTSGNLETDSLTYSLYGTYFTDRFYIDLLAGFGGIDFDSKRTLVFADAGTGVNTTALGTTEGDQALYSANFGYNIERNGWLFVPFLGYDYVNAKIDRYSEIQGQGWELAVDEQDVESQIVSAGVRLSYTKSTRYGVFVPHLRLAMQKELETDQRFVTARFVNDPTNTRFNFVTDGPDSSFFQLATGFSMVLENGVSGFVDYETITGYNNLSSSTLTLGLRFERRFD